LFLGAMPESVSATYGYVTGREVEDNAVAMLAAGNAIGVVEAGFVNPRSPFTIEVHGTGGTVLYGAPDEKLLLCKAGDEEWSEVALPEDRADAFHQWVSHIQNGTVASENIATALDLTKLMEAANRSAASGRAVRIDELSAK
jgi:predicted dehydrogenase